MLRTARLLAVPFVVLVVGCQTPPAAVRPVCNSPSPFRGVGLARQIARDTAVEFAAHPGHSLLSSAAQPFTWVDDALVQGVRKRVARFGPVPPLACAEPLDVGCLNDEIARIAPTSTSRPTAFTPIVDGAAAFTALQTLIASAAERLEVLMYIWDADPVGWAVAQQLAEKAACGVRVRVLVDLGGNLSQGEKPAGTKEVNAAVCWLAKQPGVVLHRNRNAEARFDHRKLVVADGVRAWGGGRNFTRSAFESDRDVSFIVEGGVVADFARMFEDRWCDQGGAAEQTCTPPLTSADTSARLLLNNTPRTEITEVIDLALRSARRSVYLENPYLSDSRVIRRLIEARRRGVDVRVVLSLDTRSTLFDRGNRVTANRLLAAGVRVYAYPGTTHAKAVSIDGVWAYTGTANFDPLSLRRNREYGLALSGAAVGQIDKALFHPDLRPEWELTTRLSVSACDRLCALVASAAG